MQIPAQGVHRSCREGSKIVLVLLSSGEAYIVDLRKEYRGRYELCEVQDESDDEGQMSRSRYETILSFRDAVTHHVHKSCVYGCTLRALREARIPRNIVRLCLSIQCAHKNGESG